MLRLHPPIYNPHHNLLNVAGDWCPHSATTQNREESLDQTYKIAAVRVFYDQPWIFGYDPQAAQESFDDFDLVLISDREYFPLTQVRQWISEKGWRNWVFVTSGEHPTETLNSRECYRPWYITNFLKYQNSTEWPKESPSQREFLFESLLGARRPHRDWLSLALSKSGLLDQGLVTYRDCFVGHVIDASTDRILERFPGQKLQYPYVSPNLNASWETVETVHNGVSFINPKQILDRTWYSLITETLFTGDTFFLSEKTVKAIYNQRFFFVFGARGYMQNLRKHGFRTFNDFIDESWDDDPIDWRRWERCFTEFWRLATFEDPEKVYRAADSVFKHNLEQLVWWQKKHHITTENLVYQHLPYDIVIW